MSRWLLKDTQIIRKCHVQRKPYHAGLPAVGSIPTLPRQRGEGCFGRQKQCLAPSLGLANVSSTDISTKVTGWYMGGIRL